LYKGRYDAPIELAHTVQETGDYKCELKVKYKAMTKQLAAASREMINYVNTVVWQNDKMNSIGSPGFLAVVGNMLAER
jgi:hypothetical protein